MRGVLCVGSCLAELLVVLDSERRRADGTKWLEKVSRHRMTLNRRKPVAASN